MADSKRRRITRSREEKCPTSAVDVIVKGLMEDILEQLPPRDLTNFHHVYVIFCSDCGIRFLTFVQSMWYNFHGNPCTSSALTFK